ncbi:conserved hypothetical protein [Lodderomyces elongisporus NRRL YB-4239]|uniref:rRNA-processing protein EFG1 n=1 Tax=Lodderomyces elongisporus (strain ATCC 11503 / CBS 2605 / JCM 1781 / NBRC 1676 / NRRL YB-4239) TaxID=379508 RepID=EFG1P_LODEL|nr:RecName: Full=rRNA-processing protein EFG1 [Lodderomyces elongisporus NRRL YB-4239]EDK45805.1 conserved hypothetical protein [Lodderomyces elongisporus NRRL YB-4239]
MPKTAKKHHRKSNGPIEVSSAIHTGSSAKLKKKIRDIERALKKHEKLPADKKIEYERALKGLQVELQNSQKNLKEKENASKYHMVRFFERKKATRKLKQLRKQFDEMQNTAEPSKKELKKLRKQVKHGEIDLLYVCLFPKAEKYISLYPSQSAEDINDPNVKAGLRKTEAKRLQFRKEVEKLMDEGKLLFTVDDILAGKKVYHEFYKSSTTEKEIDAPAAKEEGENGEEQDDFFE